MEKRRPKIVTDNQIKQEKKEIKTSLLRVAKGLSFKRIRSIIIETKIETSKIRRVMSVDELSL